MLMPDEDPWAEISTEVLPGHLHSRRIDASHPQDLFWALNDTGARSLVLRWNDTIQIPHNLPKLRGVVVAASNQMLRLSLVDTEARGLFFTLCMDLIEVTRKITSPSEALTSLLSRLKKWQQLLGKGTHGLLSEAEIRGLIAELHFLSSEVITRCGDEAIEHWTGPSGAPQDFQLGNCLFEVKSRAASGPPLLTISSAEQLWSLQSKLYLAAYLVGQKAKGGGGQSLRNRVDEIRQLLKSPKPREVFEEKLLEVGYLDLPDYDESEYEVSEAMIFEVVEGFPRLIPPSIPSGVRSVTYQIHLEACRPYVVDINWNSILEA